MMAAVEEFVALVGRPGRLARRRVQQARAPAPLWWAILRQQPRLAVWLALNQHLPAELLAQLACHPVLPVRMAAASNPALDGYSLARLATDASELVRLRVVCRPGLSVAWLGRGRVPTR
jgi:hypothetical protein